MIGRYDIRPRQVRALIVLLILLPLLPTAVVVRFFIDSARSELESYGRSTEAFYGSYARALGAYFINQMQGEFEGTLRRADGSGEAAARISARDDVEFVELRAAGSGGVWRGGVRTGDAAPGLAPGGAGAGGPPLWRRAADGGHYLRELGHGDAVLRVARSESGLARAMQSLLGQALGADVGVAIEPPDSARPIALPEGAGSQSGRQEIDPLARGWSLRVFPTGGAQLESALSEQLAVYQQVTLVMLGVVLTLGLLAGYGISRQLRIQDLRNTALASLAHELKTPLASSRVLLDSLLDDGGGGLDGRTREYLNLVARDNERLSRLVADFLFLARLDQKTYQPRLEVVALAEIVDEALDAVAAQAREAQVAVDCEVADELAVLGDRDALIRVFTNIFENAIVHAGDGRWMGVTARQLDGHIETAVSDRGSGIPKSELRRIFQPFHQVHTKLSRNSTGVGLGLNIVRQTVRAHRGSVKVDSGGNGTTFRIRLPAAVVE